MNKTKMGKTGTATTVLELLVTLSPRKFISLTTLKYRLPRIAYIKRIVLSQALLFAALIALVAIMGEGGTHYDTHPTRTMALAIIPVLLMLLCLVIGTSAVVRRLHDLNLSGYWGLLMLPLSIVPLLAPVIFTILAILPPSAAPNRFNQPE